MASASSGSGVVAAAPVAAIALDRRSRAGHHVGRGKPRHDRQHALQPDQRPQRLHRAVEGRRRHADVRQPRHDRAADHACAGRPPGHGLRARPAGGGRGRDGGRLRARLGPARGLQRPCRARARQCDRRALHGPRLGHAADRHRRPAGAGPRADGAAALRAAGADRGPGREVGDRGHAARRPAAHRAPRRQGRADAADRAGLHLAAGRHPERLRRARARRADPGRCREPALGCGAATSSPAPAGGRAAGDPRRQRDRHQRRLRGGGALRRGAGRAGLSADRRERRPFPVRASLVPRPAVARPAAGARAAEPLRHADLHRRRRAADVGLERGRAAAAGHRGHPARPARLGDGQELSGRARGARRRQGDARGAHAPARRARRRGAPATRRGRPRALADRNWSATRAARRRAGGRQGGRAADRSRLADDGALRASAGGCDRGRRGPDHGAQPQRLFPLPRPLRLFRQHQRRHRLGHRGGGRRPACPAGAPGGRDHRRRQRHVQHPGALERCATRSCR